MAHGSVCSSMSASVGTNTAPSTQHSSTVSVLCTCAKLRVRQEPSLRELIVATNHTNRTNCSDSDGMLGFCMFALVVGPCRRPSSQRQREGCRTTSSSLRPIYIVNSMVKRLEAAFRYVMETPMSHVGDQLLNLSIDTSTELSFLSEVEKHTSQHGHTVGRRKRVMILAIDNARYLLREASNDAVFYSPPLFPSRAGHCKRQHRPTVRRQLGYLCDIGRHQLDHCHLLSAWR